MPFAGQFVAYARLLLSSGAPQAARAARAAGRVDSTGEAGEKSDALSVEDPARSPSSLADSTTTNSGASILVLGLEGQSWAEKAQHARKLLAGLLALSHPHNFLPSMLLVLLSAFLGASSAGSGTVHECCHCQHHRYSCCYSRYYYSCHHSNSRRCSQPPWPSRVVVPAGAAGGGALRQHCVGVNGGQRRV
ncbi:unnamed protein product [Closterium sp. NIES-53]